ncbi:MAG: molybdenum cofactor biosynthesis protein MoaE [Rhodospirillaceae bacterium]|nr:molybdenum cofactor biosynthesis protein MoaE [Rhodospirillaceae bacterium]
MVIKLQSEPINAGEEINTFLASNSNSGGVATFVGQVRDFQEQGAGESTCVSALELEHYPGMTEKELERISAEAQKRWTLDAALVIHRHGRMNPGDAIVLVCAAAAHRGDSFSACEFIMDRLKTQAPFWKREHSSTDSSWVVARERDDARAKRWEKVD